MSTGTTRRGGREHLALSHPQRRAWFSELLHPGTGVGNLAGCVHFPGRPAELRHLGEAIADVVASHEALRLRLVRGPGAVPRQYLAASRAERLEVLRPGPDRRALRKEATRPFELFDAPLHAFRLLELPAGRIGFFFKYHHVVVDALTVSILNRRIHSAFVARRGGGPAPIVDGGVPYSRFLERERRYLESEAFREDLRFWVEDYAGYDPEDADDRRPGSIRTERFEHTFSRELSERIGRFCREHETTVFRFVTSVLSLYLSRRTGTRDVVIATGHHNRIEHGDMTMAGMTVSTVPIRFHVDERLGFAAFASAAHRRISECLSHQQLPFDILAERLRAEGHDPQRLLGCFVNHVPSLEGDYEVERYSPGADLAALDFKINPNQRPRSAPLQLGLDARVELYDRAAVLALFERLETLVEAVMAAPDRPLRELEHVGEREREEVLALGRASLGSPGTGAARSVLELFDAAASRSPEARAVADLDRALSYGALATEAEAVARRLVALGVERGDRVAVVAGRRVDFVVAALGAMRAGAAYVPITPETPASRTGELLAHAGAVAVLTDAPRGFEGFAGAVEQIRRDGPAPEVPLPTVTGRDLAYVIYTSGSSGAPKGVMIEHRALGNLCEWNRRLCRLGPEDVAAAYCSFMFDVSVGEVFTPLCCGASLEILPDRVRHSVTELSRYLAARRVTVATLPTRVGELFQSGVEESSIRLLTVVGEKLQRFRQRSYELVNAYGPTEATVYATAHRVVRDEPNIPIGTPGEGTAAFVVDRWLRPVARGEVGELLLAGPQIARGYLDEPALTAEVFVPNPFAIGAEDDRAYRTGDLARLRPDGALELLGRLDRQLKIRGFRVEPEEVERVLGAHPLVRQCFVMTEATASSTAMHAFYVADEGLDDRAARAYLEAKLPAHMVPSSFVSVPEIPLNPRGKTDRGALRCRLAELEASDEAVQPRTGLERRLLVLWQRALDRRDLGVTADFFDHGGDSLQAMALFADIEQELGKRLPVSAIFESPTVEQLARLLEEPAPSASRHLTSIRPGRGGESLFCVHDLTGDVMPYGNLAAHLAPDLAIRGILYPDDATAESIEELAAGYVRLVRAAQPRGPYRLLGYSIGGTIAYEMARQLRRQGCEVALLGLVDTPNYAAHARVLRSFRYLALLHVISWLRSMSLAYKAAFVSSNLRRRLEQGRLREVLLPQRRMRRMLLRYVPERYDGEVLLLKATRRFVRLDDRLGWGELVRRLEVVELPGDHVSILAEANARTLAARLDGYL